ncbi:MAG: hypothetical protein N2690_02595, partial [Rhodocyclaceae bacterium]|nr:hypothetical protein [Rhodocyclaceae bacterium]
MCRLWKGGALDMTATHYDQLANETRTVAQAMALLWTWRPRSMVYELLRLLDCRIGNRRFAQADVKTAIEQLHQAGWASEHPARPGYWRLTEPLRTQAYAALLAAYPAQQLSDALNRLVHFDPNQSRYFWPLYESSSNIAILRLAMLTGAPAAQLDEWKEAIAHRLDWPVIFHDAILDGAFDAALLERIEPKWRWYMLYQSAQGISLSWQPSYLPFVRWGIEQCLAQPDDKPEYLRLQLAEYALLSDQGEISEALFRGNDSGSAAAIRAARLIQQGQWAAGQSAFEAALKQRQTEAGAKKRVLPLSLAWFYPLALLAQGSPQHIEQARKFCIGESGTRTPPTNHGWGLWAHACAVRQGVAALDKSAFDLADHGGPRVGIDSLWALLMRAWLGDVQPLPASGKARSQHEEAVELMKAQLHEVGLVWLENQVSAANALLRGETLATPYPFFISSERETWRHVLDNLIALAGGAQAAEPGGEPGEIRIIWEITPGKDGRVENIVPYEQKNGPRGWGKPKPVSLAKLAGNASLAPHDAKVARAIRQSRRHAKDYFIELSAAIMALVGHPHVVLAGAPDIFVDVVEGTPLIETLREQDK